MTLKINAFLDVLAFLGVIIVLLIKEIYQDIPSARLRYLGVDGVWVM